ncbi:PA2169 family four-helix-bundle protein [Ferruginibacter albus]|uniref:PA2169 family four-helix-bundle protein n=1 Tax=Ferruginibacter albus TaxID=2875540 RepID=UPI001CC63D66|nr:PA2169 family four-helix-bundle protein [Ferruginibacter albus]UAY53325.1 PA2169 family four-helix-bundle protein [Ferruginibacter albus]
MSADIHTIEILRDLIKINSDRIKAYKQAAEEIKEIDINLYGLFLKMQTESKRYVKELNQGIKSLGGVPIKPHSQKGKIYKLWTDFKSLFTGKDKDAILRSCERSEIAVQKAYAHALTYKQAIAGTNRQLISNQYAALMIGHEVIKKYMNMQPQFNYN